MQIRKLSQRLSEYELPSAGRLQLKAAKELKCKIEPRWGIKSLQVREDLESNIVERRGLMIAKMPAENDIVRF